LITTRDLKRSGYIINDTNEREEERPYSTNRFSPFSDIRVNSCHFVVSLMKLFRALLFLLVGLIPMIAMATSSSFEGRWRLDPARSSALDGWNAWDLVVSITGDRVSLQHDMQWRSTKLTATNVVDTMQPAVLENFFRVEQRHMALYPEKGAETPVRAAWLDNGRTLRVEADTPIEISQGRVTMRIYGEYRLLEGDNVLLLIELHSSRPAPLVYRFNRVLDAK
jgi:hypothetical protein